FQAEDGIRGKLVTGVQTCALPIFPTPDGKKISIQQYKGKVIVAVLFATDCADCLKSIELLGKAQKEFASRGFQAVGAAVNLEAQIGRASCRERVRISRGGVI